MDKTAIENIYSQALAATDGNRLLEAIELTDSILHDTDAAALRDRLRAVRTDYEALLRFTSGDRLSASDYEFLGGIRLRTVQLLNEARWTWQLRHNPQLPHNPEDSGTTAGLLGRLAAFTAEGQEREAPALQLLDTLFIHLWTDPSACAAEPEETLQQLLRLPTLYIRVLVPALMLGVLSHNSPDHASMLLNLAGIILDEDTGGQRQEEHQLHARIIMSLILTFIRPASILNYHPALAARMEQLMMCPAVAAQLPGAQQYLITTAKTSHAGKMVSEMMPGLRETTRRRPWLNTDDEAAMKKMYRQAMKLMSMTQEGFDTNYSAMRLGKSVEFFHHPAHWFYPYDPDLDGIRQIVYAEDGRTLKPLFRLVIPSGQLCDSDCYTLVFMSSQLPANSDLDSLASTFDEVDVSANRFALKPMGTFMQDLYRFLTLQTAGRQMPSPFADIKTLLLPSYTLFDALLSRHSDLNAVIDTLMATDEPGLALHLISHCESHEGISHPLLKQKALAFRQAGKPHEAIDCIEKAMLIDDDDELLAEMLRHCYEETAQWAKVLPLQQQWLQAHPDDLAVTEQMGGTLIQMERYEEALQCFYRLEYEGHHEMAARRAIAWALLRMGNYGRAMAYYDKLESAGKTGWEDILNRGHALLLNGQKRDAVATYRRFIAAFNASGKKGSFKHWEEAMRSDHDDFLSDAVSATEMSLIIDALELS